MTENEQFTQWTNSHRLYHVDFEDIAGDHLPLLAKPNWTIEHRTEDPNIAQGLGTIETSADGTSARITTHDQPGTITITVSASVSPSAFVSKTFAVTVKRHRAVTTGAALKVTQTKNGSLHH